MTWVALILAIALFCLVLERSNLIGLSLSIVSETNSALGMLRDANLDDDAREAAAQKFAVHMFTRFGHILALTVLVCAPPAAVLALFVLTGATDSEQIWRVCMSWPFIAANLALFAIIVLRVRKT